MGRPRKPTKVLDISGAFKRNPKRKREREFEPQIDEPLGDPPPFLVGTAVDVWRELQAIGYWLTAGERLMVEQTARLAGLDRVGAACPADRTLVSSNLTKLGFDSINRSKVVAKKNGNERKDPAEAFFG